MEAQKEKKIKKAPHARTQDKRFKAMDYDPKFAAPSKNIGKVKIDKRFSKMMDDPQFKISTAVDKYGRQTVPHQQEAEHLNDYYYMEQEAGEVIKPNERQGISEWMENYDEVSSNEIEQEAYEELLENSDDGLWSEEENVIKNENVEVTKRLALCNYDWMNINAKDLMLLFSSFKPASGTIKSVTVYYSTFGKERLEAEEIHGPQGVWTEQPEAVPEQDGKKSWKRVLDQNMNDDEQGFDQRKLRMYEKERLKYCYAVIDCDSKKTADEVYKECDGNQFQNSNLLFDLRFVPNDTKFDESLLKEKATELPVSGEVKNFINKAMGHSKVSLTWEDPELNTVAGLKKKNWNAMTEEEMGKVDWSVYLNEQNEEAEDNYNKVIKRKKSEESEEKGEERVNLSDWRKECNKKYKKKGSADDIEISFPSGFDSKPAGSHESLNKQMKSKKQRWEAIKEEKRRRQQLELLGEKEDNKEFQFNPEDTRFKAVFENPLYAIDPVDPKFDHRKSGRVFEEVVKRNKRRNLE